jgi:hypothetical protein
LRSSAGSAWVGEWLMDLDLFLRRHGEEGEERDVSVKLSRSIFLLFE